MAHEYCISVVSVGEEEEEKEEGERAARYRPPANDLLLGRQDWPLRRTVCGGAVSLLIIVPL